MRSGAALTAVAVLLVGVAVMVPGWLLKDRDYLAVTPQPPAVESPERLQLPPEGHVCMDSVALDEHSEQARIGPVDVRRAVPLAMTIRGEGGYLARGRSAAYRSGEVVRFGVEAPPRSVVASVCLSNASKQEVWLAAVVDRRRSRSTVLQNGVAVQPGFVLQFAEREPVSILERFPDSIERITVFRPVSDVALWVLVGLFVAGIPILALWAYARALRHDGA